MEAGGFTQFHPLSWEDYRVFHDVFGKIDGVGYIPHAVSTQVVSAAINYRFLCTQTIITKDPIVNIVIVDINGSTVKKTIVEI